MKYVNKEDAKKLNLPDKTNEKREDGYTFQHYYIRDGKVSELWYSPKTMSNLKFRKSEQKKKHIKIIRNFTKRVKLYLGCCICGYKKSSDALQFDHKDIHTKKKEISRMRGYSIKAVKDEMRKCRVLCANCHAEHTEKQRKEGLFDYETNT
jgi:transcription elongation factor Elf1